MCSNFVQQHFFGFLLSYATKLGELDALDGLDVGLDRLDLSAW